MRILETTPQGLGRYLMLLRERFVPLSGAEVRTHALTRGDVIHTELQGMKEGAIPVVMFSGVDAAPWNLKPWGDYLGHLGFKPLHFNPGKDIDYWGAALEFSERAMFVPDQDNPSSLKARSINFLGYGQGGLQALQIAARLDQKYKEVAPVSHVVLVDCFNLGSFNAENFRHRFSVTSIFNMTHPKFTSGVPVLSGERDKAFYGMPDNWRQEGVSGSLLTPRYQALSARAIFNAGRDFCIGHMPRVWDHYPAERAEELGLD